MTDAPANDSRQSESRSLIIAFGMLVIFGVLDAVRVSLGWRAVESTEVQARSFDPATRDEAPPVAKKEPPTEKPSLLRLRFTHDVVPFAPIENLSEREIPREELSSRVSALIGEVMKDGAAIAVSLQSVDTGEHLYDWNADTPLSLASNTKLLTTAAVCCFLGVDSTLDTALYSTAPPAGGVVDGDLVVKGGGDPDLITNETSLLEEILAIVRSAGIVEVRGNVMVDDLIFDRRYVAPGWDPDDFATKTGAPVAGFSLGENCVIIDVTPGGTVGSPAIVKSYPSVPSLLPISTVTTGSRRTKNTIVVTAPITPGNLKIRGETPLKSDPVPIYSPVIDPPHTAAVILREALLRDGVTVGGDAVLTERRIDVTSPSLYRLGTVQRPLAPILARMNKESVNPIAEHLYKRAGYVYTGLGTFESGSIAVLEAMRALRVDSTGAEIFDGSGLSRGNKVSARQMCEMLFQLYRSDAREVVTSSLAILGVDGTLDKRMRGTPYAGRVIAKSGYIFNVSTLSGYAQSNHGEVIAFSVLTTGYVPSTPAKQLQHEIVKLLVDLAPAESEPR